MKVDGYLFHWEYLGIRVSANGVAPNVVMCNVTEGPIDGGDEEPIIAVGTAKVSHKDAYDKDKGRRISLARAMKKAGFDRVLRTRVWEAYRTMTKVPRWNLKKEKTLDS